MVPPPPLAMLAGRRRRCAAGILLLLFLAGGAAQVEDDNGGGSSAAVPFITQAVYISLMNVTSGFVTDFSDALSFCVKDPEKDWNGAFNFSSDLTFLENCVTQTKGDLTKRICTAAEIKFYFSSFTINVGKDNFLRPNKNCNLTSWVSGCEPGWACSVGQDTKVNLQDDKLTPSRTLDCEPCCAGFFCPKGLTCMIPCPLGSYCPLATLNKITGVCDPYNYQPPPGQQNHTCGGADRWADVGTSDIFCPGGYYCPSSIQKINCTSGHYCRKGSTSEKRCFKSSSCKSNSVTQDITIFGALLMVALSLLLLIIFNFSGQFLTNRERKQAKTREAAARMVRETAQARERWETAKNIAKKGATGLQTQLSRTFSRKQSGRQTDRNVFGKPPIPSMTEQLAATSTSKDKKPSEVNKIMHSIEENPDNDEGFNLEIGDRNFKKNAPKGKQMHTRSQIFKYAYGQIEKEKAMEQLNNNMTFSGLISMATDNEIRTRPVIEIAFKDLTLTLKGSKKQLLRCVTGKLMPGRVTAVMGPSGAGKTTFLNAVAGKVTGCETTGLVLVNGKVEPLRAYKKIIGFVPQDDIVHGNLTVEENLWFSAKCRLPIDMSKADKVLVVERVIECLGLQAVRESLVGTVEQRGISGGQRKRVNVGLEMVMEPSLLILDEPTSGLDSSSSQLLLKALRREAHEGVNICMVLHQPSYTLFRMFDDLILLAKGGLTVYHGSIKKVEEYFVGLGINVPDRVNPPDYFIDILEGIVKSTTNTGVSSKQLPVRWMLHNGYVVPRDMLHLLDSTETAEGFGNSPGVGLVNQPTTSEPWRNFISSQEQQKETLEHSKSNSKDFSNRRTPGVLKQYKYYLGRVVKQRLREARIQGVDYLILGLAGVCLGILAKVSDERFGAAGYTYTVIAVSLLCKIGALRSFSLEKLQYWRERASGMSSLAYFLSKDTVDHFNTVVKPIVYLSMFYFSNNPRSSMLDNYIILVALVYCVTGIGYVFAICFQPSSAQLFSALVPVVLMLVATQQTAKHLTNLCYTKWALEAFVVSNAERYSGVWLISRCGALMKNGYDINDWGLCILILVLNGVVSRCIAFLCMLKFQKK